MGALCTDAWMHGPEAVGVEIGLGAVVGRGGGMREVCWKGEGKGVGGR